jgi:uncharacterized protein (TIGR02246 family)
MTGYRKSIARILATGVVALGVVWLALSDRSSVAANLQLAADPALADDKAEHVIKGKVLPEEDRLADRTAVLSVIDSLVKSCGKADPKAIAAHWTSEGEYIGEDGTTISGRAALEKAYAEYVSKNAGNAVTFENSSIRFPSRDTGVVEGHMKLRRGKSGELVVSRCSILMAREDGKWLAAIVREWPGDGTALIDLEWLIGSWVAKREGLEASTTYEWTENKTFIRCQFSIKNEGKTTTGMQMIGKDPATGQLRVWTYEAGGGIGEAVMGRDGKKWVQEARGVTADGNVLTATNILTPIDADSFTWQSVERSLNDEPLPDLAPIKVTRLIQP